jgi:phosphate-selective porin OprO/OprP
MLKTVIQGHRLLFVGAIVVVLLSIGNGAHGNDVPQIPVPIPTPTATPSPEPTAEAPAPTPTPEPSADSASSDQESGDGGDEPKSEESADETPKSEQVTNPGDVAFTDYAAFDLDEIEQEPLKSKWENFVSGMRGIARYNLFDGKLKFRLGGRAQLDGSVGNGNDKYEQFYGPIDNDFSLRRLEVYAVGRVGKFNFNLAFEAGPDWGLSDAWIEGSEGGLEVWGKYLGKLRVGFMNEPFGLERQTSSYNLGLLERSLPVQTFSPGTNVGAMVHDSGPKGRFSWAVGVFSFGQQNDANASGSVLSLTGRFTYLPVYRNEGRDLIHIGLSLSSRSPSGSDTRYRSRPEARFVDYLVDTGTMDASHLTLMGFEFAAVRGPLWLQAEYVRSEVSAQLVGDPVFTGSYVQVGWFLHGNHKPYRTNSGTFQRLLPNIKYAKGNPFKKKNGGAWEVVGRLSRVDLNDGLVEGGELTDISAALNWYLNATTRVQLNYIHAIPKNQGAANIFLLRVQYQPW